MKLTVLRSSKILSSEHKINSYLENIDDIKCSNKVLKPEVRPALWSGRLA